MVLSVSVVSPPDGGADQELQLSAFAWPHKRGLDHVSLKESACSAGAQVSIQVFLPEEFHEQRSLVGYSP